MPRQEKPAVVLEGPQALKLLAHAARQRLIAEIYDGRELTATEAAELCGLTPSAMSYHLRMLEKAGVLLPVTAEDGRERRYRRAGRTFEVRGAGDGSVGRVQLQATVSIWIDTLTRAVQRWVTARSGRSGALFNESLRLTEEQNLELLGRLRGLFEEYGELSERNGPEVPQWETYWAHMPKVDDSP